MLSFGILDGRLDYLLSSLESNLVLFCALESFPVEYRTNNVSNGVVGSKCQKIYLLHIPDDSEASVTLYFLRKSSNETGSSALIRQDSTYLRLRSATSSFLI